MPEMDGLKVCRALKADSRCRHIPVIFLTAHSKPEVFMEGLEGGAVDFIPKDAFSTAVLLETLRQLDLLPPSSDLILPDTSRFLTTPKAPEVN